MIVALFWNPVGLLHNIYVIKRKDWRFKLEFISIHKNLKFRNMVANHPNFVHTHKIECFMHLSRRWQSINTIPVFLLEQVNYSLNPLIKGCIMIKYFLFVHLQTNLFLILHQKVIFTIIIFWFTLKSIIVATDQRWSTALSF